MIMDGVPEMQEDAISDAEKNNVEENVEHEIEGQVSIFDDNIGETMIDESAARQRLKEAQESQKPKKKRKSFITNLIFLLINIGLLIYFISGSLEEIKGTSLKDIIANQGDKLWWLLGGVGLFFVLFIADALLLYCLIKKSTGKKRFGLAYKVSATGKYFEAITPFAAGAQPAQIIALSNAGMSPGIATSIPIIRLIIYNIMYAIIILAFLIFGIPIIPAGEALNHLLFIIVKLCAYIGLIVTAIMSLIILLIGSGKIVGRSLVRWVVRLGYKLRIIKNYRKSYDKIMTQVLEYQSSIQYLKKNKGTLVCCILCSIVEVIAYFSIPFTIVMAFSSANTMALSPQLWIICMTQFMMCQMAAVVIPLPGGTGMMEFSFIALFGLGYLIGTQYPLGLLAWRFLTYYLTIIQGFIISTADSISRMVKAKKQAKIEEQSKEKEKEETA